MKKSAFTLIELLVVIAIIGLLAAIALPLLGKVLEKGKLAADMSNLKQIGIALQSYANDNDNKMPPGDGSSGAVTFIVSQKGTNQVLLTYTGLSFGVWHSKFDTRPQVDGDSSPISYSLNGNILTPSTPETSAGGWNGHLGTMVVSASKLVVAAPDFALVNNAVSWTAPNNIASNVTALPNKGQGMFQTKPIVLPSYYAQIPVLCADGSVSLNLPTNFNCTGTNSATWLEWDPMNPNAPASPTP